MTRKRVIVHGRVQGVFFRDATQREALVAGIAGWVRNCRDGTVEAVFEGEDFDVARMIDWTRHGPRHAEVDSVHVTDEEPEGLSGFEVR